VLPEIQSIDIAALYNEQFAVIPAATPELQDQAYALRYQVYCVEHPFEDPAQQTNEREMDRYDSHSVHAILLHKPSSAVVGCVRLVLPTASEGVSALPLRQLLNDEGRRRLDQCPPDRIGEISRYAVSKMFRRRQGEALYADVGFFDLSDRDSRRLVPHISLGLMQGAGKLAASHGITHVCAAMAPALMRLLERFGLSFEPLGPPIDYHGLRQPCIAECEQLLAGMEKRNPGYYRLVDAAYHGETASSQG